MPPAGHSSEDVLLQAAEEAALSSNNKLKNRQTKSGKGNECVFILNIPASLYEIWILFKTIDLQMSASRKES